jgi:hypothetical protein
MSDEPTYNPPPPATEAEWAAVDAAVTTLYSQMPIALVARLIAAAPDLLGLLRWFVDMASTSPMHPRVAEAKALLARIDGRGT